MDGGLRDLYTAWRTEIVSCLAHAEAVIDFGEDEDDCNDAVYSAVESRCAAGVSRWLAHCQPVPRPHRCSVCVAHAGSPRSRAPLSDT